MIAPLAYAAGLPPNRTPHRDGREALHFDQQCRAPAWGRERQKAQPVQSAATDLEVSLQHHLPPHGAPYPSSIASRSSSFTSGSGWG